MSATPSYSPRTPEPRPGPDSLQNAMPWITAHPIAAFICATLISLLLAALIWGGSVFGPLVWYGELSERFSDASGLVQALIGTALAGASALVAIVIANSATNIARAGLKESETNNTINNPDYLSAKAALRGYQKFAFLTGELLAVYRLYQQERTLREYMAQRPVADSTGAVPAATGPDASPLPDTPPWNTTLREMQALLFNIDFLSITYEMARYLDGRAAADGRSRGEPLAWALRKNVAGLASTLERYLDPRQTETASTVLMQLMARMQLLNQVMSENVGELRRNVDQQQFPDRSHYPGLHFFTDWVRQVPDLAIDRDFEKALEQPLADLQIVGKARHSVSDLIRAVQDPDFVFPWKKGIGAHQAALVTTIIGDQSSLLEAERCARETAESLGMKPLMGLPSADDGPEVFRVFTCRPDEIGRLFSDGVLGADARGCIIIDGVRSVGAPYTDMPPDQDGDANEAIPYKFVSSRLGEALNAGRRQAYLMSNQDKGQAGPGAGAGPRLVWIGIDYRELGAPAGSPHADGHGELWAILARSQLMMGVDIAKLLNTETTAFSVTGKGGT